MRQAEFIEMDQLNEISFVDPEPATIRHVQRLERQCHSMYTGFAATGFYVPLHLTSGNTKQMSLRVPPGVEYFDLVALMSQRDKTTPQNLALTITSAATGSVVILRGQELSGGNTLLGAFTVGSSGVAGDTNGPLQCRSGVAWTFGQDDLTLQVAGAGTVWGIGFKPVIVPR